MSNLPDPVHVQFNLVHDCVRACVYADYLSRKSDKKDAWWSLMDMCHADAIMSWNSIFGTNSQKAHWKKFIERLPVPSGSKLKPFSPALMLVNLEISEEKWKSYHQEMVNARNNWLAHFDQDVPLKPFPNLGWALRSCYVYRYWLLALLGEYKSQGANIDVSGITNEEMKALFEKQIEEAFV